MHFGGHDLTAAIRDGRRERLAFDVGDSEPFKAMLRRLRESGLATLEPLEAYDSLQLIPKFASLLVEKSAESGDNTRPIVEAPGDIASFVAFASHAATHSYQQVIVVVNLDALLDGFDAPEEDLDGVADALGTLLAEKSLWLIAVVSPHVESEVSRRFDDIFRIRQEALDGRISMALRVHEPLTAPQNLYFEITLAEAAAAMKAGRELPLLKGFSEYLQECVEMLVSIARGGGYPDTTNHPILATCALLIFDAALPLRPGCQHTLLVEISGNRYLLTRHYSFRRQAASSEDAPISSS